jgi:hypothetical protein
MKTERIIDSFTTSNHTGGIYAHRSQGRFHEAHVALSLTESLEKDLGTVSKGLRFHLAIHEPIGESRTQWEP